MKTKLLPDETLYGSMKYHEHINENGLIYDTLTIKQMTIPPTRIPLFQEPVGLYKQFNKTNMWMGGVLPIPQWLEVKEIFFVVNPSVTKRDRKYLLREGSFEFQVGQKVYAKAPLMLFPVEGVLEQVGVKDESGKGVDPIHKLIAKPSFTVKCDVPILTQMFFCLTVYFANTFPPLEDINLLACITGRLHQAVQ